MLEDVEDLEQGWRFGQVSFFNFFARKFLMSTDGTDYLVLPSLAKPQ